jgi:hypothetical protein
MNRLKRCYELLRTLGPLNPIRTTLCLASIMLAIVGFHTGAHIVFGMAIMQPRVKP